MRILGRSSSTLAMDKQRDPHQRSPCCSGNRQKRRGTILRNKTATLLVIVSAMLIGAGMTWQQRLLFVGGIVFGLVVEALPDLVDRLKETLTDRWRLSQVVKRSKAA
jgi:hypothetical protein